MDASSSASSTSQSSIRPGYDVFINYRGRDTKGTFAMTLYYTLLYANPHLRIFLDSDEMKLGEEIAPTIRHAIRTASVHIAIFSKNYAASPGCLHELCLMLESGAVILPVFYDVHPSDLRRINTGVYADAFQTHKRKQKLDLQIIQKWQDALSQVSLISGLDFHKFNGDHGMLIQRIVRAVMKSLTRRETLNVAEYPTGLDEAVEDFENKVFHRCEPQSRNVKMVGIVGMGGIGKTTLAKELYNRMNTQYHASCFLAEVRETALRKGLHSLQSMLLEDLSRHTKIKNTSQGKEVMKRHLEGANVFIVLDDVNQLEQLKNLLVKNVLGSGSLVLITSRNKDILTACDFSADNIYEMRELDRKHAQELFCMHAFHQLQPRQEFEKLVEDFLTACGGLPLALAVLGAQLRGKADKAYWTSFLEKICKGMTKSIIDVLKISYDELDEEQKNIFLDIACFFAGQNKGVAVRIWEASGWSALEALQTLQDRCLVGYDAWSRLKMHDHLRDMGKTIAKAISPPRLFRQDHRNIEQNDISEMLKLPSKRGELQPSGTRIFYQQQFPNNFMQHRNSTQSGIGSSDDKISSVSQFLVVEDDWVKGKLVRLLWLTLYNCPFKSIPSCFSLVNLRVLEIGARLETLWHPSSQAPDQLRDLRISSTKFRKFPKSIGSLVNLEKLVLKNEVYGSMIIKTLPDEFCDLRSLKHLELWGCAKLKSLPIRFGDLTNLRHLDLSLCGKLEMLPGSFDRLIQLQHLCLQGCYSLIIPPEIFGNISTLEHLDFTGCENLEVLPNQVTGQRCLTTLRLGHTRLKELPSSLGNLRDLKELKLNDCPNLASLPESVRLLDSLSRLEIWNSKVENLPKGVAQMKNLEELSVVQCPLREVKLTLPSSLNSSNQNHFSGLKRIVLSSTDATFISISEDVFPSLEMLIVDNCEKLILVEELPTTLVTLEVKNCKALRKISGLSYLVSLRRLQISDCAQLEELPSSTLLQSLEEITVDSCGSLTNIENVEQFERLKLRKESCCPL